MQITRKIWLSEVGVNHVDLSDLSNPENEMWFYFTNTNMSNSTCIGEAVFNCTFHSRDVITNNAVEALKDQVQEVRAKAEKEVNQLQDKINQLLAITNAA